MAENMLLKEVYVQDLPGLFHLREKGKHLMKGFHRIPPYLQRNGCLRVHLGATVAAETVHIDSECHLEISSMDSGTSEMDHKK